jgi:hypothetical protein
VRLGGERGGPQANPVTHCSDFALTIERYEKGPDNVEWLSLGRRYPLVHPANFLKFPNKRRRKVAMEQEIWTTAVETTEQGVIWKASRQTINGGIDPSSERYG